MDMALLLPYLIAASVVGLILAVFSLTGPKQDRSEERLDEFRNPELRHQKEKSKSVSGMIEQAAPTVSKALAPKTETEANSLKLKMSHAGFHQSNADNIYLTIKFIALLVGTGLGFAFGIVKYGMTTNGYSALAIGAGLGFYVPEIVMWYLRTKRQENIFLSMPDALDLLVVCVESGLGLDAGMRRVSEELSDTSPEICGEFDMCNFQLQMGRTRRDVLHDLGIRTGVDDMRSLAAILIQADRFGSSIAQALRVQSDAMRTKRMQMAEERAQKTAVQMIFPLVLFIFPGIFVVLVGPAAITMIQKLFTLNQ